MFVFVPVQHRAKLVACLFCFGFVLPAYPSEARNWRIDPAHTNIGFVVDGIGWPRTKGQFKDFNGKIAIDFDHPAASHVAFQVAAKSVDVGSSSFNDYLRTDAFFDVARYPTITFTSTHVEKVNEHHAQVTGDLTLRGVTHPVVIEVEVNRNGNSDSKVDFRATGIVHRLEFNMSAGFPAISNDVDLVVTTEALAE